jgi:hypothetical protein
VDAISYLLQAIEMRLADPPFADQQTPCGIFHVVLNDPTAED